VDVITTKSSVIVVDNVVRDGEVANPDSLDEKVLGVRRMVDLIAAEPRVSATAIQTVGGKSYDGFVLAMVNG
jgi:predicted O-methyltransferase YrrM